MMGRSRQRQRHQRARKVRVHAPDLHHDVLLSFVHKGHHPVLAWSWKVDAAKDLARLLVPGVELRGGVGDDLPRARAERLNGS